MKYANTSKENLPTIKEYFVKTHQYRQAQIKGKASATEIMQLFPRYMDVPNLVRIIVGSAECANSCIIELIL